MNNDPDDFNQQFLEEAQRVSAMSTEDQATWLNQLREYFGSRPNCEKIIENVSIYMKVHQDAIRTRVEAAAVQDQFEADVLARLEIAIGERVKAFKSRDDYAKFICQAAILGHSLPHIRERLARPDAQDFLEQAYKDIFYDE